MLSLRLDLIKMKYLIILKNMKLELTKFYCVFLIQMNR